jgi:hypothetical protein
MPIGQYRSGTKIRWREQVFTSFYSLSSLISETFLQPAKTQNARHLLQSPAQPMSKKDQAKAWLLQFAPKWLRTKPSDTARLDEQPHQHRKSIRTLFSRVFLHASRSTKKAFSRSRSARDYTDINTLPPELILDICDLLTAVDILSLCHASRWFLSILQDNDTSPCFSINQRDTATFNRRWAKAIYPRQAKEEVRRHGKGRFSAAALLCSFCMKRHPISAFSETERDKPPRFRRCIGATHSVRMCPHHTFTLKELRQYTAYRNNLHCCPVPAAFGYQTHRGIVYHGKSEQINISSTCPRQWGPWSYCQEYLMREEMYICPHMQTSDARLQQLLEAQLKMPMRRYSAGVIASVKCGLECCDTQVTVVYNGLYMWIRFTRHFGYLKDGAEPRWCAQLDKEG